MAETERDAEKEEGQKAGVAKRCKLSDKVAQCTFCDYFKLMIRCFDSDLNLEFEFE